MGGYIDLHSHWVAGIDDGAATVAESAALLRALADAGFATVVGTPHMRTGIFDNDRARIEEAFARTRAAVAAEEGLPELLLGSEHHLDDLVFAELMAGRGLAYPPAGKAVLIEFPTQHFPVRHVERLFELRCRQLRPVLAHPERYRPVWRDITVLDPILDGGTLLLLDVSALSGHYGRVPRKTAVSLLEQGYYYAACSDAHGAADVADVVKGIAELERIAGAEEAEFLLVEGPRSILDGVVKD